jgi:predicted nucleic acid-binding Zn ribbon protein
VTQRKSGGRFFGNRRGGKAFAGQGKAAGPQPLSQALSELIALRGLARVRGESQLAAIWQEVAGATIASSTRVIGVNRGALHVAVANAPLLSELASFHKASLLEALRERHGHLKIRDLKFRLKGDMRT